MDGFRIPIGEWVAAAVGWVKDNLEGLLDAAKDFLAGYPDFYFYEAFLAHFPTLSMNA